MDVIANNVFDGLDPFDEVLAFGFDVSVSDTSLVSFVGATVTPPFDDDSGFFLDTGVVIFTKGKPATDFLARRRFCLWPAKNFWLAIMWMALRRLCCIICERHKCYDFATTLSHFSLPDSRLRVVRRGLCGNGDS